ALGSFHSGRQIFDKLAAKHPAVTDYTTDLGRTHFNVANLHVKSGHHQAALANYQRAVEIDQKLIAENPGETEHQVDLAQCFHNLADLQREMGDLEASND